MLKRLVLWMMAGALALALGSAGAAENILGPGDVLKLSVYGSPDLNLETRVSEMGFITFPLVGQVSVGGMQVAAVEKKIGALLESGGFVRKAQVNIIVTVIQSQQVSVLGQVNRPGRYPLEGKRSLIDMLAMAGGIASDGADSVSLIRKRNGKVSTAVIDVVAIVRSGMMEPDLDLTANDVIFVERAPHFFIYGEVQRPGMFKLERGMTVVQALSAGGGLAARGTERGMVIKRHDANGKAVTIEAKQDDLVKVDDVVYVKESLF